MFIQTILVSLLLLLLGLLVCFAGFRLFVILLPVFGFFAGFLVTTQAIQELFGGGFLATVSSWVFGLLIGAFCGLAAYFFYVLAVAILAVAVGYELGVGILAGLGVSSGVLLFVVGLAVAAAVTLAVFFLNLPKIFIVALTAIAGAGMIMTGILLALGQVALPALERGVVGAFISASWFWSVVFVLIMAAGVMAQLFLPEQYELEPYWQTPKAASPVPPSVSAPVVSTGADSAPMVTT